MQATDQCGALTHKKTCFSNKIGVYSAEDQTITWTADNGVRLVSYLNKRATPLTYPQYEDGDCLDKMVSLAKKAFEERGESLFSETIVRGVWSSKTNFHWHVFFDPHLMPIVTSFSRYPQAENSVLEKDFDPDLQNDLSTPYNSYLSRNMLQNLNIFLPSFSLPPASYALIHKSISSYFAFIKNYEDWAIFADKNFFKPWSEKLGLIEGYSSFSSMAWATVSKFVLGVPESEFIDYAHVWNTLLESRRSIAIKGFAMVWHFPAMEAYILKKIRKIKQDFLENPTENHKTIIHYWLQNKIAEAVIEKLTFCMKEEALSGAKNRGINLEEMVYVDNFFALMIGMQENIAFILTQTAYHFSQDPTLANRCKTSQKECKKMVRKVIEFMPPAGSSRQLRWDSDLIDPINNKIYSANKGDQFVTMHAVTTHLAAFSSQHEKFNFDDESHVPLNAFSEGPHRCPGQMTALNWLFVLTQKLAQYEFSREALEEPEYYNSFIMRDGGMKFKISVPLK